jgi:hypothetical protein
LIRKKHSTLRVTVIAIAAFVITFLLTCLSVYVPTLLFVKTDQASAAAHASFQQIPQIEGIELVDIVDTSFVSDEGGKCCCSYGRLNILYGISLPFQEAAARYGEVLPSLGWTRYERRYGSDNTFIRGDHEYLNISHASDEGYLLWWGGYSVFRNAQDEYPDLMIVRIDHILPGRNVCWGRP